MIIGLSVSLGPIFRVVQALLYLFWMKEPAMPTFTLMFLGTVVSLGFAFVWMFWEIENQARVQRRTAKRSKDGSL